MTAAIAIGVGCRIGCPAASIEALVREALDRAPAARRLGLFTICDKAEEPGLIAAADSLGLDLTFIARTVLQQQAPHIQTRSIHAQSRFGVPSVAEAAALAGAGTCAVLIIPRIARHGVTCAIAEASEGPQ
ncbi:MAG TPA: cobalamin biosynthesis protein [Rhodopila sp.]